MQYRILTAINRDPMVAAQAVTKQTQEYIDNGYVPLGPPFAVAEAGNTVNGVMVMQAVLRTDHQDSSEADAASMRKFRH